MILLLFTSSFPYDYAAEYSFVQPEMRHLLAKFEKVILVPRVSKGTRLPLPAHAELEDDYANFLQRNSDPRKMLAATLSSRCFSQEIRKHPSILFHPSKVLKLILFSGRAELTRRWVIDFFKTHRLDPRHCILYSYWFDHATTGLAMAKPEFPSTKLVSRAHGYDIYEEYYYPYYWPDRHETLNVLDTLFFASDAGRNYFCQRYPAYLSKYETAHLGVKDPTYVAAPSSDGIFRIVSCANMVPVKRLDLLLDGIAAAARLHPEQKFEWTHFGDGAGRKLLDKRISRNFPANAQAWFRGNVPNHEIMQHYKEQPVDVFVNVSSTEGGAPLAIQEAISCGIPIVATSVGGNPEVVSDSNGILLEPDPTPEQIGMALMRIWDNPLLATQMRKESLRIWQTGYNAEVNFRAFAERLKSLGER